MQAKKEAVQQYITTNPQIMGGAPVIVGTRIPIERLLFLLKDGYNIDAIHEEYPWVEKNILEGVLDELAQLVNTTIHGPSLS